MSKGVLLYAHNNKEIDYISIACANSMMIAENLTVPVSIVTDKETLDYAVKLYSKEFIDNCFDKILLVDRKNNFNNIRQYNDSTTKSSSLQFYNCNHWEAYDLSPYEETLFIDSDYLIMSNSLSKCWGSNYDVMIDNRIYSTYNGDIETRYIDDFSIPLYWATVIYFKKSETAQHMFDIVKHVQENYRYYRDLYGFMSGMYRNDYAFSIAIHVLNDFSECTMPDIGQLPIPGLLMSWDTDDIHSIPKKNDIIVYSANQSNTSDIMLSRFKETDIHIMNKWAINREAKNIINLYKANK